MSRLKLRKKASPRIYLLDGRKISSDECYGFVSTARKEHACVVGNHRIQKGERLVRFNYFGMSDPICLRHALQDWDTSGKGIILGVKTGKARGRWGIIRNSVICERFFFADLTNYSATKEENE